jgi:predicted ATP-grasp superfamily ATP-dependent carboligase
MTRKGSFGMIRGAARSVLVFEWMTGGGLAKRVLPASLASEGAAMRRAIAADFANLAVSGRPLRVIMSLDARLSAEPGPWTIARIDGDEPFDRLLDLARTVDFIVLVAPETTGILARLTRDLKISGAQTLGCTAEAAELTADKGRLATWLQGRGIDTPPSRVIVPALGLPADTEYPAVLKPVDGAGSVDTFYVTGAKCVAAAARAMPTALLQPYVAGEPASASFLVDEDRRSWLIAIGRQHMAIRDGRFEYQGGTLPVPWTHAATQLRPVVEGIPGLRGFVGVDFVWDARQQRATVLEVNARPTTSYVGLCHLVPPGRLAEAWLAACGELPDAPTLLSRLAELLERQQPISFRANGSLRFDCGVLP